MNPRIRAVIETLIFIFIYVLLGNARSVQENPFIPGANIAVNMIVPVLAGILFGKYPGLAVGLFGTLLNALSAAGTKFEYLAIIPHAIMGYTAGSLKGKAATPFVASTILIGHALNLLVFTFSGLIHTDTFFKIGFWKGIVYESIVGIIIIVILTSVYHLVRTSPKPLEQKDPKPLTTNSKVWKILFVICLILVFCAALLFYFRTLFLSFVIGITLVIMTQKLQSDFQSRVTRVSAWKRQLYGYVYVLFGIFVVGLLISNTVEELSFSIDTLRAGNQSISQSYLDIVEPLVPPRVSTWIEGEGILSTVETWIVSFFTSLFTQLSSLILTSLLIIPLMFYLYFKKGNLIKKRLFKLVPKKFSRSFQQAFDDIRSELNDFLTAKIVQSIIIAVICCFGFYVIGLKAWLFLGLLAGFLNIIPYIGPVLGAVLPVLVALIDGPTIALYAISIIIIAQLVDNFYLQPFLISSKVRIEPIISVVLILSGAQLFGALGMIFAIPIYLVCKIILREVYTELVMIYKEKGPANKKV